MRVLLLRPHDEAARAARSLAARGHEATIAPVLTIARREEPLPAGPFDVVLATSAQAFGDLQGPGSDALRTCAGETWTDATLASWPVGDFRLFCGDLGKEVDDGTLAAAFRHLPSFARARVVRDAKSQKSKNFGFVSFLDAKDALTALKDMQGAYVGSRPVRLRRAEEAEKSLVEVQRKAQAAKKAARDGGVS